MKKQEFRSKFPNFGDIIQVFWTPFSSVVPAFPNGGDSRPRRLWIFGPCREGIRALTRESRQGRYYFTRISCDPYSITTSRITCALRSRPSGSCACYATAADPVLGTLRMTRGWRRPRYRPCLSCQASMNPQSRNREANSAADSGKLRL